MTTVYGPANALNSRMRLPAATVSMLERGSTLPASRTTKLLKADVVAGRVAHPGAGGVVSRWGLFELLQLPSCLRQFSVVVTVITLAAVAACSTASSKTSGSSPRATTF